MVIRAYIHSSRIILHYIYIKPLIRKTMKNILRANMRRFGTKNLNEQSPQFSELETKMLDIESKKNGYTKITDLRLRAAFVKREDKYVTVFFDRDDILDAYDSNLELDGKCEFQLFLKNGKIDYTIVRCVDENEQKYRQMEKFVGSRLHLPAYAEIQNFSSNILTLFGII